MKSQLSISTFLLIVFYSTINYAQPVIPNGNFEKLAPETSVNKFESWESISFFDPLHARSTDAHSGASAMKVFNKNGKGGDVYTHIKKSDHNHPLKLRGFVKYTAAPGEKVMIAFKVARNETKPTQTITYTDVVGWKTFTGTSNGYEAFEIVMDYSLADDDYLENNKLDLYNITISAYDDVNINSNSALITDKTFILVDDLTLDGELTTLPTPNVEVSDNFENWNVMDNDLYAPRWMVESYVTDEYLSAISQSTDASEGRYAMKIGINQTKTKGGLFSKGFIIVDPTKKIEVSLKYNLGIGDTLRWVTIQSGFKAYDLSFISTNDAQNQYKTIQLDMSKFSKDSICFFLIGLSKGSPDNVKTFTLIDDIKWSKSLSVESIDETASQVVVFPNPSVTGNFTIMTTLNLPYKLIDVFGNPVATSFQQDATSISFNLSGHPKGIYFLKIGNTITKKLIY